MTHPTTIQQASTTTLPAELLVQFYAEAAAAVSHLGAGARDTADRFRNGDRKRANDGLSALPAELRNFIVLVNVVDGQLGLEPCELRVDDLSPAQQLTRLSRWFESIVEAQKNGDALTIADILEYDLEPYLGAWSAILTKQGAALTAPGRDTEASL